MVLHPAIEVRTFDTYGFHAQGLFVKHGHCIHAGETVWYNDPKQDAPLYVYTGADIRNAPTTPTLLHDLLLPPPPNQQQQHCNEEKNLETATAVPFKESSKMKTHHHHHRLVQEKMMIPPNDDVVVVAAVENGLATSATKTHTNNSSITSDDDTSINTIVVSNPQETLKMYSYMIDDDCFASTVYPQDPQDSSYYYNHSCQPNTAYQGDDCIVALETIHSNTQVTYDYAFTETQDSFHTGMHCMCHSVECRGILTMLQYKDPTFIAHHYHHCTTFIQRKMRENGWTHNSIVRRHLTLVEPPVVDDEQPPKTMTKVGPKNDDDMHDASTNNTTWNDVAPTATTNNGTNSSVGITTGSTTPTTTFGSSTGSTSYGLFAREPIPKSTLVLIFSGKIVAGGENIERLSRREQEMCLQIDTDMWQIPNVSRHPEVTSTTPSSNTTTTATTTLMLETSDYINHSCVPNCGMLDAIRVVTMRDIAVDEEITLDYAMIHTGGDGGTQLYHIAADTFSCHCRRTTNIVSSGTNAIISNSNHDNDDNGQQCRGLITPNDYKVVGHRYGNYLSPFVRTAYLRHLCGSSDNEDDAQKNDGPLQLLPSTSTLTESSSSSSSMTMTSDDSTNSTTDNNKIHPSTVSMSLSHE